MKVHHLNCGTLCPISLFSNTEPMVCHCLLIETEQGLVLVDTGFGLQDILRTNERIGSAQWVLRPKLSRLETALVQIQDLGFHSTDVKQIILTHMDFDHAGGISDFPNATVHVYSTEYEAANQRRTLQSVQRYRPIQWKQHKHWEFHRATTDTWNGFDAVKSMTGLPPEILLIPLHGHTIGHCAVAVDTPKGWLFHAGDAYFHWGEMAEKYHCPGSLQAFQSLAAWNDRLRRKNLERLRRLSQKKDINLFCSHDKREFKWSKRT